MKLAFKKGTGFASKLIEFHTSSPYSHVELEFSDGLSFSARAELTPAVNIIKVDHSTSEWDLVTVPAKYDEAAARAWAEARIGEAYDWDAIVGFAVRGFPDAAGKLICSGSCTGALQVVGLFKTFTQNEVSPGQLYTMIRVVNELLS